MSWILKDEKRLIAQRRKERISQPAGTRGAHMGVRKVPVRETVQRWVRPR